MSAWLTAHVTCSIILFHLCGHATRFCILASAALSRPFGAAFQSLLFSRSAFTLAQLASHTHDRGTAQPVLQLNACAWTSWMTWLKRTFPLAGTILLFITIRNDPPLLSIRFIHISALSTVIYSIRFIRPDFALMYIAT